jgi:hypothetical protein
MLPKERSDQPVNARTSEWNGRKVLHYTNRLIVKFKPLPPDTDRSASDIVESVRAALPLGAVIRAPKASGRTLFGVSADVDVVKLAEEISQRPDVEYAEPDVIDRAQVIPSDVRYPEQWHLPKINAVTAWDYVTGSASSVLIGIIDSGISMSAAGALDHPDLNDGTRYLLGTDFVDGGVPRDTHGHGTHVCGIAAAESNNAQGVCGMNWGTHVYICRTLDGGGNGSSADFADAVEEIVDFAAANNLKVVINYSAGGGANQTKQDACQYLNDHGMMLCAATGNDNGGAVIFPAAYSTMFTGVIAVGSTDSNDTVSSFSNVGPEVTVVAPGRGILSTMPTYAVGIPALLNYDFLDGTSMATPVVTGLIGLMWSRHPSFASSRIRQCLIDTAKKLGAGSFNNSWGNGRVEAEKAVRCGDITFTIFTQFTSLTSFTHITKFTPFTPLTSFTSLTHFTLFTSLTRFTSLTLFTQFTRFTRFSVPPAFTRFPGPIPEPDPPPFIRFSNTVFSQEELSIRRFGELQGVAADLQRAGFGRVDEIAVSSAPELAASLGYSNEDAQRLVALSQALMRALIEN